MHMKLPKDHLFQKACDLTGPSQPSSKGNTHVLVCTCLLTNYPIAIAIPHKIAETIIQPYLQNMYASFGGSFTLITNNGNEFKNKLFQNIAE